jgi:peptide/nickel transport system permease protein
MAQETIPVEKPWVELLEEEIPTRKPSWFERAIGPEPYRIIKGLLTTPISVIGIVLLALFVVVALAAPAIMPPIPGTDPMLIPRDGFYPMPYPPGSPWVTNVPPMPFWWQGIMHTSQMTHVLGTTGGQYDILYGLVWGTRTAFYTGLAIVIVALIIGLLVGSLAAYYGGALDNVLMRIVDIFMTLPFIMAALILSAILIPKIGRSPLPAMIALIAFGWMGYARLVRGDILTVRERDYVLAARVLGVPDRQILMRHILPNAIYPTLVIASMDIGGIVLNYAALSFLGVGVEEGYAEWGQMASYARDWITQVGQYWYNVVYPGIALTLFVLAWNLIGDAFRDISDPRLRGAH